MTTKPRTILYHNQLLGRTYSSQKLLKLSVFCEQNIDVRLVWKFFECAHYVPMLLSIPIVINSSYLKRKISKTIWNKLTEEKLVLQMWILNLLVLCITKCFLIFLFLFPSIFNANKIWFDVNFGVQSNTHSHLRTVYHYLSYITNSISIHKYGKFVQFNWCWKLFNKQTTNRMAVFFFFSFLIYVALSKSLVWWSVFGIFLPISFVLSLWLMCVCVHCSFFLLLFLL